MTAAKVGQILEEFQVDISDISFQTITDGYINDTFLILENEQPKFILQKLNTKVFSNFEILQSNIDQALTKLKSSDYCELEFLTTKNGSTLAIFQNEVWRLMKYIANSIAYNTTTNSEVAYEAGRIIGVFHRLLQEVNVEKYDDVISNFHHLPTRIEQYESVFRSAEEKYKLKAKSQIEFIFNHSNKFEDFYKENLPLRICHNDTKLNNILFDPSNKALCLIDLDTIMKGYFHYDFGDAIRTIVNSAAEDTKNVNDVNFDRTLFSSFIQGLKNSNFKLTKKEIEYLPLSVALMPFLHGLRALSDYLSGSHYYKINYDDQNLDRCKALFQFTSLAFEEFDFIKQSVRDHLN